MKKVGIVGITGRTGSLVEKLLEDSSDFVFYGGISGKSTEADRSDIVKNSDVLVDFSRPSVTVEVAEMASGYGTPLVTGTTGLSPDDLVKITEYSKNIPIMHCSNFSIGAQLTAILLKKCAAVLKDFDLSIVDLHHKGKKDSPSGTALFLAQESGREAKIVSIRSGNAPGDHVCNFCGEYEMLTVSHRVFDRRVFAKGALECTLWLLDQKPSLYGMADYLSQKANI